MTVEQDVLQIGKQLEKIVSDDEVEAGTALDLLERLKELPITLDILQKTRIGMSVNSVRKASSKEDIQSLAKSLIKSWKKLLDEQSEKQKAQKNVATDKQNSNKNGRTSPPDDEGQPLPKMAKPEASFPPPSSGGDVGIRKKCYEMIFNSLKCSERPEFEGEKLAKALEESIYCNAKDTGTKYRNQIKSRVMNLRDKRNPELLMSFIDGVVTPARLAKMTSEEMASDDLKKEREKFTKEAINDHQMSTTGGTQTSLLKCGKCGKRNVTYNQVQTRSADEPMTTFCYCNECGHRWKFC